VGFPAEAPEDSEGNGPADGTLAALPPFPEFRAMNRIADSLTPVVFRLGGALLLAITWVLPAWNKLSGGGVPGFFQERFGNTILASFPGITVSFYSIAILEAVAGLLALGSVLIGEFLPGRRAPLLKLGALLSLLVFVQLGFGLRLIGDNDGAANLFFYAAGSLVLIIGLHLMDRPEAELDAA
ncbi:MAG: hypothetical protein MH204_11665, partial [Fimbriimonadaceae bacterium]|nr:hypothetical protein [Fimbriimonadaceae bacterium]